MSKDLGRLFSKCSSVLKDVDFFSLRLTETTEQLLIERHGVLQPPEGRSDSGAMISVHHSGGMGYAATCDLSAQGIEHAARMAKAWAEATAPLAITNFSRVNMPVSKGRYQSPISQSWLDVPLKEQIEIVRGVGATLRLDNRIIDSVCRLWNIQEHHWHLNSLGADVEQEYSFVFPAAQVTAEAFGDIQRRTFAADSFCRQGGWELLRTGEFATQAVMLAEEAIQLAAAPMCPEKVMDILIAPDQMILQIHESIGHPIELDRILGDERNYAGTSFVTLDMFGSYQYGSNLLNVLYQPDVAGQVASYNFDDDALAAKPEYVIKGGVLIKPLGGVVSQARAGMEGVANVRAQNWNRPPIDRMANLNVEPGISSFNEMLAAVESGIFVKTNNSWSIDDSRNKFQFGCEWGQLIEKGKLTKVVKQPNYRGVSSEFWRNLAMVGDSSTYEVLGTPFCGKGEPNQVVRVGHASPACLFKDVSVFGGV